jgi:tetratricopeptide (TPR) repeat protein
LPLALDHAGAYCRLTALTFDAYRKKVDSLISKAPRSTTHESVGATFELAIEKAASDGSGAEELLGALAFLAPERIGLELIDDSILSVDNRAEALGSLAAVSLVEHLTLDKDMPDITLHRLVQAAMRRRLADKNKTATTVAQVTRGLREAFPAHAYQETKYWPRCAELLPHVLALRELALWDDLSKIAAAGLLNRAASYLHGRASYTQPEAFFREAIKFVDAAQDTEEDKAIYQNNLATLLTDTGRFAEAEPLFREAIKLGENTIGREHPEIATRLVNLGRVLQLSGRPKEAEPLYREAIAIDEKTYGREHPEVATDLNVLADMLVELGRHDDAEPLLREGLAIRHKLLGRDHWYTAISERCLGKLLLATGREDEAIPHVERALEISARIAGPEHPRSKAAARTYARALGAVGRSEEAASVMAHYQVSED